MSVASLPGGAADYIYNALGQMVQKSGNGGTTLLMYDERGHLLGEYSSTGALVEETVWMGDVPVATLQPNGSGVSIYYVHSDQLNAPRVITRPSDNAIAWRWDTDPFGTVSPNQNPAGLGSFVYNLRFPGQYYLPESGLNYNYFRDYDPQTGRYIESDPIGLAGGSPTTYGYAGANPLSNVDPRGEFVWPLPVAAGGVALAGAIGYGIGTVIYNVAGDHIQDVLEVVFPYPVSDPALQQQIERGPNQAEVHRICDEPPPPNMNPCERAKWELNKARACKAARQSMTDRWFNGAFDAAHNAHMQQLDNQIANAIRAVNNACKQECSK